VQQNSGGDWGVKVEVLPGGDKGTPVRVIPFNLMVLGDDAALNSDMITVAADYAPGDKISIQARVNEFEKPLLNLDTQRGAKMLAKLVRPGVSLGDLLSDSTASSTPLPGQDKLTSAQAKLENTLLANPSAFVRNEDTLRLLDNGDPANGDAVAGDGIYSAVFPAQLEGHYNFLFALEGNTQNLGRFSRQQLKTVHVRAVPDAQSTQVQTHVQATPDGNKFIITLTPRTKFGHRMGPGWANYFWFTSPGISPFKATDNLNGTFTANLSFNGSKPPPVQVHFLDIPVLIGDSVTPDKLPVPLDDKNVFIPSVTGSDNGPFRFSLFTAVGSNFPHGTFNTVFDTNVSLNGGLEYRATNHFSVEGLFGYHRFGSISSGINLNLYQVSANGKVYGGSGNLRPFANFGGGVYKFGSGTTEFGNNVGGGLQFNLSPRLAIEGGYNFHSL